MKFKSYLIVAVLISFVFASCEKEEEKQARKDDEIIVKYLSDSIKAIKHSSGLYYRIIKETDGANPSVNSTVTVCYKGYLTDGTVFDATKDNHHLTAPLKTFIEGWQIGIPLIKKGEKATLFIPSKLGYGNKQIGNIPANSVLIFDIHLIDFR